ncbi:hypothetical protein [Thermomonospora amylolytica]|uniref:hypothetical protein n=1 Tax=Thermomonospora amylolytica TaxID=1411117 RepID=UPI000E6CBEED|nr:hypothetical protein [Thermomonospora amylolytica]
MTEFSVLMNGINEKTARCNTMMLSLHDTVVDLLNKVPGWLDWWVEKVQALLAEIKRIWTDAWDQIKEVYSDPGNPMRLAEAADVMTDKVQSVVSAQAAKISHEFMHVDDRWRGPASEKYKGVIHSEALQPKAVRQYSTTASNVSGALNECRWAIVGFWLTYAGALALLLWSLVKGIRSCATIAGVLPGLLTIMTGFATFSGTVSVAAVGAQHFLSQAANTFKREANGNDYLPGGHWPPVGAW